MKKRRQVALKGQKSFFELHKIEHARGRYTRHEYTLYLSKSEAVSAGEFWRRIAPEGVIREWAVIVRNEYGLPHYVDCSPDYLPF